MDVLHILANVAGGSKKSVAEVRVALGGISEWFDEYIATEESDPGEVRTCGVVWCGVYVWCGVVYVLCGVAYVLCGVSLYMWIVNVVLCVLFT